MTAISERDERINKLLQIQKFGVNPYPSQSESNYSISNILENFSSLAEKKIIIHGRLISYRSHGKLIFANIQDERNKIQIIIKQDKLGIDKFNFFKNIDVADFIEITGTIFLTEKGEKSILVENYRLLTKSLLPLPDKWHGIQDEEMRYRKRYLDLIFDTELKEMFRKKTLFWQNIRNFLINKNFLEVETPILETTCGGADADPFITHHNALGIDLYLRISMGELWQKRLMIGGFEKTFEIGRQFRNEGIDSEHLQDYTQMEFYMAYADYNDTMKIVEEMFKKVILNTFNSLSFKIKDFDINFDQSWPKIDYVTIIKQKLNIDVLTASDTNLIQKCKELNINIANKAGRGRLIDSLWKQIRKNIPGPAFLINHPVEVSPLAKRKTDDSRLVERYQVIVAGSELGNGYSELNDPLDQAQRFKEQAKMREEGDSEAQMHDHDFIEALEHGMPPTSGFGFSERLFAFLVNKPVRECVLFPLLRPKNAIISLNSNHMSFNIKREESIKLLKEHIKNTANFHHALESEAVLRGLADHLKQNADLWGTAGLLHDLDWEETENNVKMHGIKTAEYLNSQNYPNELISAIKSHNYDMNQDTEPTATLDYAVRCGEMVTGLIYAATLVRPDKKIASMEVKSVKKKLKDKAFAANVQRDVIKECEKIGINIDDFLAISLKAIKSIADQIGI